MLLRLDEQLIWLARDLAATERDVSSLFILQLSTYCTVLYIRKTTMILTVQLNAHFPHTGLLLPLFRMCTM